LENNWLQFSSKFFARLHNEAEVVVINAVNIWDSSLPLVFQESKSLFWNSNVVATSVNNCWHFGGSGVLSLG
jgi:hypothetical protein